MNLSELKRAARLQQWEKIDEKLPQAARDPRVILWAKKGIESRREYLRDLAASSLVLASLSREAIVSLSPHLYQCAEKYCDHPSGFRAACALAVHNPSAYRERISPILKRWALDKEVGVIAQKYLHSLESPHRR